MKTAFRRTFLCAAIVAGCSVPYEVDPNFGAATDAESDTSMVDSGELETTIEETESDTGFGIDSTVDSADSALDTFDSGIDDTLDTAVVTIDSAPDTVDSSVVDTAPPPDTSPPPDTFVPDVAPDVVAMPDAACAVSADCPTGYACCGGLCKGIASDLAHCGACGAACTRPNAAGVCSAGTCGLGACNANFGDCDGVATNGCERPLSADVNNCGACGKVCATTNGTAGCAAGACTVTACSSGYSNCDGNPAACEINHNSAFNTCATAQQLLDGAGAINVCSTTTTETTFATGSSREGFYKVHLVPCGGCGGGNFQRVRFNLVNPAGAAYDLRVWEGSTCSGGPDESSASGVLGGTETATFNNYANCGTSARDFFVEVRYRAGRSCASYTLTATGAY